MCESVYGNIPPTAYKFEALSGLVTSYHSDSSAGMCVRAFVCVYVNVPPIADK